MEHKVQIIILAAGKGKRMGGDLPKVLMPLRGKPMISHLLETLEKIEDKPFGKPYIVVGHGKEIVIKTLGDKYHFVEQKEQRGTGDAVRAVKHSVREEAESVVVLCGDMPFIKGETIEKLIKAQVGTSNIMSLGTVHVENYEEWRKGINGFGRVIRENGKVKAIVEYKDATEEQRKITEVNPFYFCFDAKFLWNELEKLSSNNAQNEYYLVDILKSAISQGLSVSTIEVDAKEALGANTQEELEILENLHQG
ncbi:NTP transferase domain-containing protein [Patescibacteria group bacterium]|nr:NTP transferase domain-containing protein [Patescibacteria group bacterium]